MLRLRRRKRKSRDVGGVERTTTRRVSMRSIVRLVAVIGCAAVLASCGNRPVAPQDTTGFRAIANRGSIYFAAATTPPDHSQLMQRIRQFCDGERATPCIVHVWPAGQSVPDGMPMTDEEL